MATAKVVKIGHNPYNLTISATLTDGETKAEINYIYKNQLEIWHRHKSDYNRVFNLNDYIKFGDAISGGGIASGTYVEDVFTRGTGDDYDTQIILSESATASGDYRLRVGPPIDLKIAMSQLIWWFINRESTTKTPGNSISSKSINGQSVSYAAADTQMDNQNGVPAWFTKAVPKYASMF